MHESGTCTAPALHSPAEQKKRLTRQQQGASNTYLNSAPARFASLPLFHCHDSALVLFIASPAASAAPAPTLDTSTTTASLCIELCFQSSKCKIELAAWFVAVLQGGGTHGNGRWLEKHRSTAGMRSVP